MKYYIIAGEASGDLHAANLIKALRERDPAADVRAWGGDLSAAAGATVVKHYRELAFMGFVEVLKNLRTILRNMAFCKADILGYRPDVLVLVDYPGFNLRIAAWAKRQGIRVCYYISPQIWAWHSSRAHAIKRDVDEMLVILPFEADFYARYDYPVHFVGHPLLDVTEHWPPPADFHERHGLAAGRPILALLPGSRRQEISSLLPLMLEAAAPWAASHHIVVAGAPSQPREFYDSLLKDSPVGAKLIENQTYDLLSLASAALVTSGTATLETALFGVPQVVCYKGSPLSYWIARRVVNVAYISLVNLVLDRPLVPELIQGDCTVPRLREALRPLLGGPAAQAMREGYAELRQRLGERGASARAASLIVAAAQGGPRQISSKSE